VEHNKKDVGKNVGTGRSPSARAGLLSCLGSSARPGWSWVLAASLAISFGSIESARATSAEPSMEGAAPIAYAALPPEAQRTEKLILAGGPFPYSRDGIVFMNREGHLQGEPRGYYHEYTVPTPGAKDRGARRIICGGAHLTEPEACFYTQDHYSSFHRILN
jgi:ribonuclease T1